MAQKRDEMMALLDGVNDDVTKAHYALGRYAPPPGIRTVDEEVSAIRGDLAKLSNRLHAVTNRVRRADVA